MRQRALAIVFAFAVAGAIRTATQPQAPGAHPISGRPFARVTLTRVDEGLPRQHILIFTKR